MLTPEYKAKYDLLVRNHYPFTFTVRSGESVHELYVSVGGWGYMRNGTEAFDLLICHAKRLLPVLDSGLPVLDNHGITRIGGVYTVEEIKQVPREPETRSVAEEKAGTGPNGNSDLASTAAPKVKGKKVGIKKSGGTAPGTEPEAEPKAKAKVARKDVAARTPSSDTESLILAWKEGKTEFTSQRDILKVGPNDTLVWEYLKSERKPDGKWGFVLGGTVAVFKKDGTVDTSDEASSPGIVARRNVLKEVLSRK